MRRPGSDFAFAGLALLLLMTVLAALAAPAAAETYVASGNKILVFDNFDSGDHLPKREISGPSTELNSPFALALDLVHRELWVVELAPKVLVFAMNATGDTAPIRKIEGAATGLNSPRGVMLDLIHDEVFVTDFATNSVRVFSRPAGGDLAPIRVLTGATTGLNGPVLGFLDLKHDELVVANYGAAPRVAFFARVADGDQAPLRAIQGNLTGLSNPRGTIVNLRNDLIAVSDYDQGAIFAYPRAPGGNVSPVGTLAGGLTEIQFPFQMVTTDFGQVVIGTDTTVNARVVMHSLGSIGNVPPSYVLSGPQTGLSHPTGVANDFALECAWGNSVDGCLFRDNFESGELCYWSEVQGGTACL